MIGNPAGFSRRIAGWFAALGALAAVWLVFGRSSQTAVLDFSLPNERGEIVSLALVAEAPIAVVHFWATWCAPCVDELPELLKFADKRPDVRVVLISLDEAWSVAHKILPKSLPGNVTSLLDAKVEVAERWGSYQYPETYLLARGKLRGKLVGPQDWHLAIEALK